MSLVFDEFGRPFIIIKEQQKKTRLKGIDATKSSISAAKSVGKILRTSLGPRGMDKMIQDGDGRVTITNDGATILEKIELDHRISKVLLHLSRSQDDEVGDGTTSVVLLSTSLLEMAEPLIDVGIHPMRISEGYQVACDVAMDNLEKIAEECILCTTDAEPLLYACMTSLSSNIVNRCKRSLAELCVRAIFALADSQSSDLDIEHIKVEGKVGGKLEDTTLVNGIVIDKDMSHPQMTKHIENAKIALLTCPFEPPKPKTKHYVEIETAAQFDSLRKMERDYFEHMVQRCKTSGANLIICQWGFDDEANHLLMHHNLPAVRWVGGVEMELIAMATGARIVSRFQEMSPEKLGSARVVWEAGFGTSKQKMIFIEGCPLSRALTLLVRGGNEMVVDETKRSLHDALCVARNLLKSNAFVYGGGAAELSCSLAILQAATSSAEINQFSMRAFADALEQIPLALAKNAGYNSIEAVANVKARQIREANPRLGVDCNQIGTNDMREQRVLETLFGKKQSLCSANQVCKMILKIDDVIAPDSGAI